MGLRRADEIYVLKVRNKHHDGNYGDCAQTLGNVYLEKWALLPSADIWQCLEIFLVVTTGVGRVLLASSGHCPGMLLNIP